MYYFIFIHRYRHGECLVVWFVRLLAKTDILYIYGFELFENLVHKKYLYRKKIKGCFYLIECFC